MVFRMVSFQLLRAFFVRMVEVLQYVFGIASVKIRFASVLNSIFLII